MWTIKKMWTWKYLLTNYKREQWIILGQQANFWKRINVDPCLFDSEESRYCEKRQMFENSPNNKLTFIGVMAMTTLDNLLKVIYKQE